MNSNRDSTKATKKPPTPSKDNQKMHVCETCKREYRTERRLTEHKERPNVHACNLCNKVIQNRYALEHHKRNRLCEKFKCTKPNCNKKLENNKQLKNHINTDHSKNEANPSTQQQATITANTNTQLTPVVVEFSSNNTTPNGKRTLKENEGHLDKKKSRINENNNENDLTCEASTANDEIEQNDDEIIQSLNVTTHEVNPSLSNQSSDVGHQVLQTNTLEDYSASLNAESCQSNEISASSSQDSLSFEQNNNASKTNTVQNIKKVPLGADLETIDGLKFLLKLWNINDNASEQCIQQLDPSIKKILVEFPETTEEIILLLQKKLEEQIGYFIIGVALTNFMRKLTSDQLVDLYINAVTRNGVSSIYPDIIEMVTVCKIKTEDLLLCKQRIVKNIPHPLRQQSRIFKIIMGTDKVEPGGLPQIYSKLSKQMSSELSGNDFAPNELFDTKSTWKERCHHWDGLFYKVLKTFNQSSQSLYDTLLLHAQDKKVGTVLAAKINTGKSYLEQLHLHPEILSQYSNEETNLMESPKIIKAKSEDIDTFIQLLYKQEQNLQEKVTMPVFEISKALKIKDVWNFLFPKKIDIATYSGPNKAAIFQIALSLQNDLFMLEIGKKFNSWIPTAMQDMCLRDFSAEKVIWFLNGNYAEIGDLEKYKMVLHWAHAQYGETCPSLPDVQFDEQIAEQFRNVYGNIKLKDFGEYEEMVIGQGFIPL